jgi:hypothetical protein
MSPGTLPGTAVSALSRSRGRERAVTGYVKEHNLGARQARE